jgi:uncharacterized protein YjeT (DUF2065 family)
LFFVRAQPNLQVQFTVKKQTTKRKVTKYGVEVRVIGIILGIVVAAIGGVIAYRALFLEPSAAVVITETDVRELPDTARVVGGMALLAIGAVVAFLAARKRS